MRVLLEILKMEKIDQIVEDFEKGWGGVLLKVQKNVLPTALTVPVL